MNRERRRRRENKRGEPTKPVVYPEVRDEVPDRHVGPAKSLTEIDEGGDGQSEAEVAQEDELGILAVIQRASGVEMVDATAQAVLLVLATALALALVEVVARDVGEEVVGPTHELLDDEHQEGVGGRLFCQLGELVDELTDTRSVLLPGSREEYHVALHVARGLVVLAMGHLPAEIGDEQGRVEHPANEVVESLGGGEGAMTALVGKYPDTGSEEALDEGV